MRIILSAYACAPNTGSEPGFGWNWAIHLAREGHDVIALTLPCYKPLIRNELKKYDLPNLHFIYINIPPIFFQLVKKNIRLHYIIWQWAILEKARELAREVDLIHHVTMGTLAFASQLWRIDRPFIMGPVGGGQLAPKAFSAYFDREWNFERMRFVTNKMLPLLPGMYRMMRESELILVTNEETSRLAHNLGATNVAYFLDAGLPDWYILDELPERVDDGCLQVLWVGRIMGRKALPLALEALSQVHVPFKLTILGDGSLSEKLPKWVANYGLNGKVDWRGRVSWNNVRNFYKYSDVFLFTSLRDSFGSQLLEAMANGLPIITLNHQGAKTFIPDKASIKINPTSPQDAIKGLVNAIESIAKSNTLREEMGRIGLEFARTQTWTQKAKRMTNIYTNYVKI